MYLINFKNMKSTENGMSMFPPLCIWYNTNSLLLSDKCDCGMGANTRRCHTRRCRECQCVTGTMCRHVTVALVPTRDWHCWPTQSVIILTLLFVGRHVSPCVRAADTVANKPCSTFGRCQLSADTVGRHTKTMRERLPNRTATLVTARYRQGPL